MLAARSGGETSASRESEFKGYYDDCEVAKVRPDQDFIQPLATVSFKDDDNHLQR